MHLTVIKPTAEITSLDLEHLPVWQLRMEIVNSAVHADKAALALGIRYLAPGSKDGTCFVQIMVLECKCQLSDLMPVIRIGFPPDRALAKDRLKESLKVLYNSPLPAKEVDEILPKSGVLVDAYFNIRDGMFGKTPALAALGPIASGEHDGYRWAITRQRFESWPTASPAGADCPPPPGAEPETIVIPGAVPGGSVPPPPGTGKRGGKGKGHGTAAVE